MYQPAINSQGQGQLKKSTGRNKPVEVISHYVNDKGKKNVPIPGVTNKVPVRKPVKNYNKQITSGRREKSFSKNDRKVACADSRNYMEQNSNSFDGNEPFALHHLLNFQYSSGRNVESNNSRRYQFSRRKKTYFNKEEYLQAKCHFVVIGSADNYSINAVDPDKLVDWDQIHLVYLPSHDPPNCPICLYSPVAAKITRCGHIFCWSCILHYLHLGEKAWRKCPICHEAVHKNDLKSVKSYAQRKYARLDLISMKLMRRAKDSVFVLPKAESESSKVEFSSWIDHTSNSGSKIMLATPDEVVQYILMEERNELRAQLSADMVEENGEDTFISMALEILEEEIKSFKLKEVSEATEHSDGKEYEVNICDIFGNDSTLSAMLSDINVNESSLAEAAFSDDEFAATNDVNKVTNLMEMPGCKADHSYFKGRVSENSHSHFEEMQTKGITLSCPSAKEITLSPSAKEITSSPSAKEITLSPSAGSSVSKHSFDSDCKPQCYVDSYYFYQAEDGQNIFLHSLNARCLIEEYGSLDAGPLKITGQIIDFECFTMTKELRKRFRYLSHLPLSCEFLICELILKPPLLSKHTIHNFMPEFKNRKALRLKKFKEQQKFDRQATAAGNKQHGFLMRSEDYDDDDDDDIGIDLSNTADFPCSLSPESAEGENKGSDENGRRDDSDTQQFQGLSFAQMLNKKTADTTPRKEHAPVNNVDRSFQGAILALPRDDRIANDEDDGPEIVAPDFKQTFSAAMFAAPIKNEKSPVVVKGKGGKKKRDKGMLLFATGGQRKY